MNTKNLYTKKYPKAFTLIEILLVMLITSVLILGVNAAFRQAHVLWSRAESQRPVYHKTRLFFDTLTEELLCLYIPNINDEQHLEPFSLSTLPDGPVELSFFTLNPVLRNTVFSNLPAKVSYEFAIDPDSGWGTLSRTEQLFSGEKAVAKEQKEIFLEGFSEVSMRAADPNSGHLSESWKTNLHCRQRPPKAVEIQLKWPRDETTDFEFENIIKIACQEQLIPP